MTTTTISGPYDVEFIGPLKPNATDEQSIGPFESDEIGQAFVVSVTPPLLGTPDEPKTTAVCVRDAYLSAEPGPPGSSGPLYTVTFTLQNTGFEPIDT